MNNKREKHMARMPIEKPLGLYELQVCIIMYV